MIETTLSSEVVRQHGITEDEYARIVKILGRDPHLTELGIFSVMWSEHCSYKSSRCHLKRLPTRGPCVLQGPGENAGVIDLGDGIAVAFKIESHNHPSFVEPFQGAATGVGGILRDIFTMGARPIAAMNSLRFGSLHPKNGDAETALRNRRILRGVVAGIAFYGNCFGVPTVGGEVYFEDCYSQNPLVNAFALGIFEKDELTGKPQIFLGKATGVGNAVIYIGAKTGRDGIHGASLLASSEFDETTSAKRPNVQVGDPFLEKCLLEACLEAMQTGAVLGIQDMGAAGLTCSTCEMAARGGAGVEIELERVPQRETGMNAYEIMLSESQERMLLVAERARLGELQKTFSKWGLDAVEIGSVTDDGMLRVRHHGEVVAEIPAQSLANDAPVYERPMAAPTVVSAPACRRSDSTASRVEWLPDSWDVAEILQRLLTSENLCSRRWVYQQYDYMVRTNTCVAPGSDAAVIRVKGTSRGIALSLDGNGRYTAVEPREGAKLAVAEACRNLACVGARPLAATNCLNFGNPEKPEVMWSFSEVIDGMKEACEVFGTPITGGNVSFYNESYGKGIYPTPVIGLVGVVDEISRLTPSAFQNLGDVIALMGDVSVQPEEEFQNSASEFLKTWRGEEATRLSRIDLHFERSLQESLRFIQKQGLLQSCHDLSEGGLAVTVAECCFGSPGSALGADIDVDAESKGEAISVLFAEKPSRVLISFSPVNRPAIEEVCRQRELPFKVLGHVVKENWVIRHREAPVVQFPVKSLFESWDSQLAALASAVG